MNSGQVNQAIRTSRYTALKQLLDTISNDDELTTEIFLRCLCRQPTKKEIGTMRKYLKGANNRREAYEDLAWSLVNSAEFQYRN
jgi:glucuronate isomerase